MDSERAIVLIVQYCKNVLSWLRLSILRFWLKPTGKRLQNLSSGDLYFFSFFLSSSFNRNRPNSFSRNRLILFYCVVPFGNYPWEIRFAFAEEGRGCGSRLQVFINIKWRWTCITSLCFFPTAVRSLTSIGRWYRGRWGFFSSKGLDIKTKREVLPTQNSTPLLPVQPPSPKSL